MKQRIVRYIKLIVICTSLLVLLCSCNKSVDSAPDSIGFEKLYSGFIACDSDETEVYQMSNYYIITNENQWDEWNDIYTKNFPYFQDEFNWDKYCIITYTWVGAKDFWNTIDEIDAVNFDSNGNLSITYNSNPQNSIYAFDTTDIRHVALEVIKIKKSDLPSNIQSSYYDYSTISK